MRLAMIMLHAFARRVLRVAGADSAALPRRTARSHVVAHRQRAFRFTTLQARIIFGNTKQLVYGFSRATTFQWTLQLDLCECR